MPWNMRCGHSNTGLWIIFQRKVIVTGSFSCQNPRVIYCFQPHTTELSNATVNLSFARTFEINARDNKMQLVQLLTRALNSRRMFKLHFITEPRASAKAKYAEMSLIRRQRSRNALSTDSCSTRWPQKSTAVTSQIFKSAKSFAALRCFSSTQPLADTWEFLDSAISRAAFISFKLKAPLKWQISRSKKKCWKKEKWHPEAEENGSRQ